MCLWTSNTIIYAMFALILVRLPIFSLLPNEKHELGFLRIQLFRVFLTRTEGIEFTGGLFSYPYLYALRVIRLPNFSHLPLAMSAIKLAVQIISICTNFHKNFSPVTKFLGQKAGKIVNPIFRTGTPPLQFF